MKTKMIIAVSVLLCPSLGSAQHLVELSEGSKADVVRTVAGIMRERYVFADVGERMAQRIVQELEDGSYDPLSEVKAFCREVTADLREVSNDKHLYVFYSPTEAREVAARNGLLTAEAVTEINRHQADAEARGNYGIRKVEILDGNVGYVALNWFSPSPETLEKQVGLMTLVSHSDALIIDLRDNFGGGGGSVRRLMSYFFEEKERVPFTGVYWRESNRTEEAWSIADVPGDRMPDVELYLLTNARTFSAAEDFAYSLQALERAVVVGESTRGGAHPVDVIIVEGDILTQVSIGNSVNPITGTNWEANGVIPDLAAPSDSALYVAHVAALESVIDQTSDRDYMEELQALLAELKNR